MTTTIGTKPILTIDAIYSHIATDEDGKRYHHWSVNHDARQEPSVCAVCGKVLDSGWHCIDSDGSHCDSDLYCDDCIIDIQDAGDYIRELESRIEALKLSEAVRGKGLIAANETICNMYKIAAEYIAG